MPSIVEVRVCDALSPEDAASLEKDDAPLTPKPPKDFTVSFAESVTRTANVYASSRPPSRRGVSGKEHTRFTLRAQKDATETSAKLDSLLGIKTLLLGHYHAYLLMRQIVICFYSN